MDPNKDQDKDQKQGPLTRGINAANRTRDYIKYGKRAKNLMQAGHAAEGVYGTGAAGEGAMGAAGAAEGAAALAAGEGAAAGGAAAGGAAAGGAAAGTAPAWIVPVAIIGVVLLVVVIIVLFFGGGAPTANGGDLSSPTPSATSSGSLAGTPSGVYYCQWSGPWKNQSYDDGTVGTVGCTVTATAMILSSYGANHSPGEIATDFHNNNWDWLPGNQYGYHGSKIPNWPQFKTWVDSMGFTWPGVDVSGSQTINFDAAQKFINSGCLLLAASYWAPIQGGHGYVVQDVNKAAGTMTVRDPNNGPFCRGQSHDNVITVSTRVGGTGWYYLVPICPKH